ncbi:hypothetical protein CF319_g6769 [Tilletia indica]|nr:hypothetical protein CF319_g6769 [Tilletia indica]
MVPSLTRCRCYKKCTDRGSNLEGRIISKRAWQDHKAVDSKLLAAWPVDGGQLPPAALRDAVRLNADSDKYRATVTVDSDSDSDAGGNDADDFSRLDEHDVGMQLWQEEVLPEGLEYPEHLGPSTEALAGTFGGVIGVEGGAAASVVTAVDGIEDLVAAFAEGLDDIFSSAPEGYDGGYDPEGVEAQDHVPPLPNRSCSSLNHAQAPTHIGSDLFMELLGGYVLGSKPTEPPSERYELLDDDEKLSLVYYRRWLATGGTEWAYKENAKTLQELDHDISSFHVAKAMAAHLSDLQPLQVDMCKHSCLAYVGDYANMDACPWIRTIKEKDEHGNEKRRSFVCGEARYGSDGKPSRQYVYLPILDRLRVMFRNPDFARLLQYRHDHLQALRETRDRETRDVNAWDDFVFGDVVDGLINLRLADEFGLFTESTDVAISIATDGAQLLAHADSSAWFITASCLNTPPTHRFKRAHQFILAIIPGPNSPGDIESFFRPIAEEMAKLHRGAWVWDGSKSEWFVLRAYLVGLYADQPGSSKLNKMTGTQGRRGCRFCEIDACYGFALPSSKRNQAGSNPSCPDHGQEHQAPPASTSSSSQQAVNSRGRLDMQVEQDAGVRANYQSSSRPSKRHKRSVQQDAGSSATIGMPSMTTVHPPASTVGPVAPLEAGSNPLDPDVLLPVQKVGITPYFPLRTPSDLRKFPINMARPLMYDAMSLPMRSDSTFRAHIMELQKATSKTARKAVGTRTGVSALPLLAFSPAFTHPDFFPLDVFHLFSFNTLQLLWNTMRAGVPEDPFVLDENMQQLFGKNVVAASKDLPGTFGKAPRDTHLFHNTHYKMVEWITAFHCYFGPFLHAQGVDDRVLGLLMALLDGIGVATQSSGCTFKDVAFVRASFMRFAEQWETLYIRGAGELVKRARLSIHLLLHIGQLIASTGSVRATSQAACERTIGTVKKELRSFKDPFVTVERRVVLIEQVHALEILVDSTGREAVGSRRTETERVHMIRVGKMMSISKVEATLPLWASYASIERAMIAAHYDLMDGDSSFHPFVRLPRADETDTPVVTVRSYCSNSAKTKRLSCRVAVRENAVSPTSGSSTVSFFDLVVFAYRRSDAKLIGIGRRLIPSSRGTYSSTAHWVNGTWSTEVETVGATDIIDVVGLIDLAGSIYVFPRKTPLGGFCTWWAKWQEERRSAAAE